MLVRHSDIQYNESIELITNVWLLLMTLIRSQCSYSTYMEDRDIGSMNALALLGRLFLMNLVEEMNSAVVIGSIVTEEVQLVSAG